MRANGCGLLSYMRIVTISNRLPFTVSIHQGQPRYERSSGGLTTGLWTYLEQQATGSAGSPEITWLGWPGTHVPEDLQQEVRDHAFQQFRAVPVYLPDDLMDRFYHGFCNKTVWPLFHYFASITRYDESYWRDYVEVNRRFADALIETLRPDDVLWVHDYHLMLVPAMVRERFPQMPIGFFLHIPFPSYEVFRLLPRKCRTALIEGLLGSSLIGFHTHDYTRDFLSSVLRTVGYEHHLGLLTLRDRTVKVDTFPMGIDFDRFARTAGEPATLDRVKEMRARCEGLKVIFSVDRLDYTKGLLNRLQGYDSFLKHHPEWHGKVVFMLSVAPSRIGVESYQSMKQELEQAVGRIVGQHGNVHWTPLVYQYRNVGFNELVAMYRFCDVALVTPLRDGMNLVAKEFVASRPDQKGVLILSEMAGAAKEMGEAILINPFDPEEVGEALHQALTMPPEEQTRRNGLLQERLRRYSVSRWASEFVEALVCTQREEAEHRARLLTGRPLTSLIQQFQDASRGAILLDYDGTLVPFVDNPKLAGPDPELLQLLRSLSGNPRVEVALISGRSRLDLENWFGHLPIRLIAEHGIWVRPVSAEWQLLRSVASAWKDRIRPILQLYVDRLPGAFLEEKEYSLAWHYRRADPEQANTRAKELLDAIADYTRNIDVQILEGNKVLEVRHTAVNKGTAVSDLLPQISADFVMGIGDDWTDEDMFRVLPRTAFSIRVGLARTFARFYLPNHAGVRKLLNSLVLAAPRARPDTESSLSSR